MSSSTAFLPIATAKRNRTSSQSSGSSINPRDHLANKASRLSSSPTAEDDSTKTHPLLCTLPPTCNHKSTPLKNTKELESHYATYHAHVCEQPGCGSVFPDARLLELHQTENHDPIAAMKKERGEKIFGCHLQTCGRLFSTPKTRRLHLISAHGYPKEYFFAVTNKGVGGLLKKWGEGASMVRGKWTPREATADSRSPLKVDRETMRDASSTSKMEVDESDSDEDDDGPLVEDDSDDEDLVLDSKNTVTSAWPNQPKLAKMALDDPETTPRPPLPATLPPLTSIPAISHKPTVSADTLSTGMSTLSLVPPSVRFGRGGRGGFVGQHATAAAGHKKQPSTSEGDAEMVQEGAGSSRSGRGVGRGRAVDARGRGRGRGGRGA